MSGEIIVEIAQDGRQLTVFRGFLKISEGNEELAKIPLDTIHAIMLNCHQASISQNILLACAEAGIPIIVCGSNHNPAGMYFPVVTHHKQAGNLQLQLQRSQPLAKQLWKEIIRTKIMGQHLALCAVERSSGDALLAMAKRVKSGDSENVEAQAARRYWSLLMGNDFTRDQNASGANSLLNYGYAILRSTVARAVIAVGLIPSLGIHHMNRLNAFCLIDDLMEVFRPSVDIYVFNLLSNGHIEVTRETKHALAKMIDYQISMNDGATSLSFAALRLAQSLVNSFESNKVLLALPRHPMLKPHEETNE